MQPGEEMQPQNTEGGGEEVADEALVLQLVSMGFPESKCKRAALSTGNKGRSWLNNGREVLVSSFS